MNSKTTSARRCRLESLWSSTEDNSEREMKKIAKRNNLHFATMFSWSDRARDADRQAAKEDEKLICFAGVDTGDGELGDFFFHA